MNAQLTTNKPALAPIVQDLIASHGRLRLGATVLISLLRQPRPPDDLALTNHLRRDIGLSDLPAAVKTWQNLR
jgi:hypothetical protein